VRGRPLEEEKEVWISYIEFEIREQHMRRARLLYERGLISLDKDVPFWLSYVQFLDRKLKDPTLVRAKYELRLKHAEKHEKIEVLIEEALFEEDQGQVQKARKLFERLQSEIAPDYLKSLLAFINFEKRCNNFEKAKELYYRAFSNALAKQQSEVVAFIVIQYARFLTFVS